MKTRKSLKVAEFNYVRVKIRISTVLWGDRCRFNTLLANLVSNSQQLRVSRLSPRRYVVDSL
ncbi:MAG: hypothetical protein CMJ78_11290 [Planctomycetaceae bacterium]|nr:hypothetical protein [Planctomycetaceae bacterium]